MSEKKFWLKIRLHRLSEKHLRLEVMLPGLHQIFEDSNEPSWAKEKYWFSKKATRASEKIFESHNENFWVSE